MLSVLAVNGLGGGASQDTPGGQRFKDEPGWKRGHMQDWQARTVVTALPLRLSCQPVTGASAP